jgi:hypothetical protein
MGLDQYVYRVKKPSLEKRVYTSDEISKLGLSSVLVREVERCKDLFAQLIPYAVKRDIRSEFIDTKKIIDDYNLPKNSHIGMMGGGEMTLCGYDSDGNRISHTVGMAEIEKKYTVTEVNPGYIWEETEVKYWRKNYELQDLIYELIEGVDNTGYYMLSAEIIRIINKRFGAHITPKDPTSRSALFYWEWY